MGGGKSGDITPSRAFAPQKHDLQSDFPRVTAPELPRDVPARRVALLPTAFSMREFLSTYGLLAAFLLALLENDVAFIAIGIAWKLGGQNAAAPDFNVVTVVAAAILGALLHDTAWYALGYLNSDAIKASRVYRRIGPMVERLAQRFGPWEIFLARFIYGTRNPSSVFWGMQHLPYAQFAGLEVFALAIWGSLLVTIGFHFTGAALHVIGQAENHNQPHLLLAAIAAAFVVVALLRHFNRRGIVRLQKRPTARKKRNSPTRARPPQWIRSFAKPPVFPARLPPARRACARRSRSRRGRCRRCPCRGATRGRCRGAPTACPRRRSCRNAAPVQAPPWRPPLFLMRATSLLICVVVLGERAASARGVRRLARRRRGRGRRSASSLLQKPGGVFAERHDAGAGERREIDDRRGVQSLARVGDGVGEDDAAFGVGVHDLDVLAVVGRDDVAGPIGVAAGHVFGAGDEADDVALQPEPRRSRPSRRARPCRRTCRRSCPPCPPPA